MIRRTWGLETIRVIEEVPRPPDGPVLWPKPPIIVTATVTFQRVRTFSPDELESQRTGGIQERKNEGLRLDVWRSVHMGLADELRSVIDDLEHMGVDTAKARIRALIDHLDRPI